MYFCAAPYSKSERAKHPAECRTALITDTYSFVNQRTNYAPINTTIKNELYNYQRTNHSPSTTLRTTMKQFRFLSAPTILDHNEPSTTNHFHEPGTNIKNHRQPGTNNSRNRVAPLNPRSPQQRQPSVDPRHQELQGAQARAKLFSLTVCLTITGYPVPWEVRLFREEPMLGYAISWVINEVLNSRDKRTAPWSLCYCDDSPALCGNGHRTRRACWLNKWSTSWPMAQQIVNQYCWW